MTKRTGGVLAVVVALGLLAVPLAAAHHLPELLTQEDEGGAHTLRLLIDDGTGGVHAYTPVNVTDIKMLLVGVLKGTDEPLVHDVADALEAFEEPVTEAGVYTNSWSHAGSPMFTVGAYFVHRDEGLFRVPLVLFENVTDTDHLAAELVALVLQDGVQMLTHVLPFLMEYLLVDESDGMKGHVDENALGTWVDKATIYVWHARKVEAGQSLWHGWYLERTGSTAGTAQGLGTFEGTKRVEIGTALRSGGVTEHAAGVYLRSDLDREASGSAQEGSWQTTLGVASAAAGDIPLVTVRAEDERWAVDGDLYETPEEQRTRFTIGVYAGDAFVPLVATETYATHRHYACPAQPAEQPNPMVSCIEQVRVTSVGTFLADEYVPVAGLRYHGERSPLVPWVFTWLAGGGPGAQNAGDWSLAAGTFLLSEFVPLVGVHYEQAFPEARDTFQMRLSLGVYVLGSYQPLVATTYDGKRPLVTWAGAVVGDDRTVALRWMTSSGVFVLDRYVPVLGMRYLPHAEGGDREQQHQFAVGTFLADYAYFVPIAGVQWDGDAGPAQWVLMFAGGGLLGSGSGEWDLGLGVFLLGTYHPVVGVESRDSYEGPSGPHAAQQELRVGVYDLDGAFVPLVGIVYGGQAPLLEAIGDPASFEDDQEFRLTAGAYLLDAFVPLIGVHHSSDGTTVTLAPSTY